MIYFTSDLHFGHDKEFLYKPRGFSSIYEHDNSLIKNWNSVVNDDDFVYVLGDLMLNNNEYGRKCFNQLKGLKEIILGNHDTESRILLYPELRGVENVCLSKIVRYGKYNFFLCHYPTMTSYYDNKPLSRHLICLCGHTHSKEKFYDNENPYVYNVAIDAHDNYPVSIEEILNDIRDKVNEMNISTKTPA